MIDERIDVSKRFRRGSDAMRSEQLDRITNWCQQHADVTHADQLAKTIQTADWNELKYAFWSLFQMDEPRALAQIIQRCAVDQAHQAELVELPIFIIPDLASDLSARGAERGEALALADELRFPAASAAVSGAPALCHFN